MNERDVLAIDDFVRYHKRFADAIRAKGRNPYASENELDRGFLEEAFLDVTIKDGIQSKHHRKGEPWNDSTAGLIKERFKTIFHRGDYRSYQLRVASSQISRFNSMIDNALNER